MASYSKLRYFSPDELLPKNFYSRFEKVSDNLFIYYYDGVKAKVFLKKNQWYFSIVKDTKKRTTHWEKINSTYDGDLLQLYLYEMNINVHKAYKILSSKSM